MQAFHKQARCAHLFSEILSTALIKEWICLGQVFLIACCPMPPLANALWSPKKVMLHLPHSATKERKREIERCSISKALLDMSFTYLSEFLVKSSPSRLPSQRSHRQRRSVLSALLHLSHKVPGKSNPPCRFSNWPLWGELPVSRAYLYMQGVPGGMCQTSGECSLP